MKRKTVQTKYDVPVRRAFRWASEQKFCEAELHEIFRIPAPWLTKEIIFVCTVFLSFTLWMTCERTLIHAQSTLWIAPQNLQFTLWNSRFWDECLQDQNSICILEINELGFLMNFNGIKQNCICDYGRIMLLMILTIEICKTNLSIAEKYLCNH